MRHEPLGWIEYCTDSASNLLFVHQDKRCNIEDTQKSLYHTTFIMDALQQEICDERSEMIVVR